jgi:hypothetical protein
MKAAAQITAGHVSFSVGLAMTVWEQNQAAAWSAADT